jgi:hypothetical protein
LLLSTGAAGAVLTFVERRVARGVEVEVTRAVLRWIEFATAPPSPEP